MDLDRFDGLTRNLSSLPSRRGVLGGLTTALFATLPLALGGEDAAARKKNKKNKKKCKGGKKKCGSACIPRTNCCTAADCDDGETCQSGSCTTSCTPQCDGRTCGDDGCDGTCGSCGNNEVCDSGTCVCVPDCAPANACGADGCGESCGTCAPNPTCQGTQRTVTECRGGVCTPVTTSCGAGQVCFQNACCTKNTPPTCRKQPVSDGCGGTFPANCGPQQFCCDGPNGDLICQAMPCP
jgi:hypothetical protein